MGRAGVANVRDAGVWSSLGDERRGGHPPSQRNQLTLAVLSNTNYWCRPIWINVKARLQIAEQIATDAEQPPHGLLARGDVIEVAHKVIVPTRVKVSKH